MEHSWSSTRPRLPPMVCGCALPEAAGCLESKKARSISELRPDRRFAEFYPWPAEEMTTSLMPSTKHLSKRAGQEPYGAISGSPLWPQRVHTSFHFLEMSAAQLGTINCFFRKQKQVGVFRLFADFLQEGADLGEHKVQFTAEGWLKKQFFANDSVQHKSCSDSPVTPYLAEPVVFLRAEIHDHLHEVISASGPERGEPPLARFAHFGFTPEIVELQNQSSLFDGGLCGHFSSKNLCG